MSGKHLVDLSVGSKVILFVVGDTRKYQGEVTQAEPVRIRVDEYLPMILKPDDFVISLRDTLELQKQEKS